MNESEQCTKRHNEIRKAQKQSDAQAKLQAAQEATGVAAQADSDAVTAYNAAADAAAVAILGSKRPAAADAPRGAVGGS